MRHTTLNQFVNVKPRQLNPYFTRVLLVAASTLFTLMVVELGLRFHTVFNRQARLEKLSHATRFIQPTGETHLGHIVRASSRPGVVYELIPNVSTVFRQHELQINSDGFRGTRHPESKPDGTVRILGLGDSVMFGWGVPEGKTYLDLLAERLNVHHPEINWEVVNTAVPGYNTAMEAAVLETRGLAYEPDIVIVGYVPNDIHLPNFLLEHENPWTLSKSYLVDFFQDDAGVFRNFSFSGLVHCSKELATARDERLIPASCRYMVGTAGYANAMRRIQELSKQHNCDLYIVSHIDWTPHREEVHKINHELGVALLYAEDHLQSYMKAHEIQDYRNSELVVSADDPHPSAVWHSILCNAILQYMHENGLIRDRVALASKAEPASLLR